MDFTRKDQGWVFIRKDGHMYSIMPGMMFVGREECDIILQSASSDKRHAVIFYDSSNQEIHIKDLNSLTGTYVNGIRIPEQTYVKLKHSDTLRFGYGPDIFHIQNRRPSASSPPQLALDSRMCQSWSEKADSYREKHSPSPEKMGCSGSPPRLDKSLKENRKTKLHDSLEDLQQQQQQNSLPSSSICDSNISSIEDSCHPSVSPAFSSLTFKKNTPRTQPPADDTPSPASVGNSPTSETKTSEKSENESFETCNQSPVVDTSMSPAAEKPEHSETEAKEETTEGTGPLVMAFTVAFDNHTPKKKFNIKDSISKYAPKKADPDRSSRLKQDKVADVPSKKAKEHAQQIPAESSEENKVQLRKKKGSPEKTVESIEGGWKLNQQGSDKSSEPKLSHGATYLIQKMFRGSKSSTPNTQAGNKRSAVYSLSPDENVCPAAPPSSPVRKDKNEHNTGNEDAKSDTGTYTVDEELNNKVVEDARKKIDEVFGVPITEERDPFVPGEPSPIPSVHKAENQQLHQSIITRSNDPKPEAVVYPTSKKEEVVAPPRTKRRLPIPPVQKLDAGSPVSPAAHERPYSFNYGTYSTKSSPDVTHSFSQKDLLSNEEFPAFEKKSSIAKERTSFGILRDLRFPRDSRLTVDNLEMLQNYSSDARKGGSLSNGTSDIPLRRTPPSTWRRAPWTLSGSDMDLDQMKVETSSVLSDVSASTEPPSGNQSSARDGGPQMKFNRAFALRRARLGLETDLPQASRNIASKESKTPKSASPSGPSSASPLSRQDGGRFSLRLPKSTSKTSGAIKTVTKPAANKPASGTVGQKFGHRRMDSDPAKTAFLRRGIEQKMSVAPTSGKTTVKGAVGHPPFHRAASFSNNEGNNSPAAETHEKLYDRRQDRLSMAALRSIPRATQSPVLKPDDDDSHHRASPRPVEKSDLSALDNLVIQATHQLSAKLKNIAHNLLVKERDKFTEDSSERLMIDEVLPRVSENTGTTCSACGDRGISQDLANILKNLKRVEQSLEVLTIVVDEERMDPRRYHHHHHHNHHHASETEDNLYVVNV